MFEASGHVTAGAAPSLEPLDADQEQPVLSVRRVSKSFVATKALQHVDLDLYPGKVVGLVGDNGAGKSTLVKVIAGVLAPDSGTVVYQGRESVFPSPLSARLAGIETVYQDLALCNNLNVYQNIFLGREIRRTVWPLRALAKKTMRTEAGRILSEGLGVAVPLDAYPDRLSGGQRQLVALARSEAWQARVLLLDEPTAALSTHATRHVIEVIRRLQQRGVAVLIISHDLPQVVELTDRIVVLRQGRTVAALETTSASPELLLGLMTGMIRPDGWSTGGLGGRGDAP
jgi:ABC-type sugar transport system ATPase subunit